MKGKIDSIFSVTFRIVREHIFCDTFSDPSEDLSYRMFSNSSLVLKVSHEDGRGITLHAAWK